MRPVSAVLKNAIYRSDAGERVFIVLIEIDHADLAEPLRFTSDRAETVSNGETYTPFPFSLALPSQAEGIAVSRLQIQNVHRDIVRTIRTLTSAPSFRIWVVLDDDPDRIEAGPWNMMLASTEYDQDFVTADIEGPSFLSEPYPSNTYSVLDYPGL